MPEAVQICENGGRNEDEKYNNRNGSDVDDRFSGGKH